MRIVATTGEGLCLDKKYSNGQKFILSLLMHGNVLQSKRFADRTNAKTQYDISMCQYVAPLTTLKLCEAPMNIYPGQKKFRKMFGKAASDWRSAETSTPSTAVKPGARRIHCWNPPFQIATKSDSVCTYLNSNPTGPTHSIRHPNIWHTPADKPLLESSSQSQLCLC